MNSREYVNKFLADFNIPRDQVRIKKGPYETYSSYIEPGYYGLYIPEETAPHYRELEAKKAEYSIGHYETVTAKWGGGRGAEWKTLVTIKCAEDNHNTKLEEGMSYTDEVIRFIQDYDNGSMWDKFVVAFEDVDDANLDASNIIEWMQNYPDLYDAFLTDGDEDDVYEALNRAHELDEQTDSLRLSVQQKRDICSAIDNCFNGITVVNRRTHDVEKLNVKSSYKDGKDYGDRYRYRFTLLPKYVTFSFIQDLDDSQKSRASELKNKLERILSGMSFTVKSSSVLSGTDSYSDWYPVIELWIENS